MDGWFVKNSLRESSAFAEHIVQFCKCFWSFCDFYSSLTVNYCCWCFVLFNFDLASRHTDAIYKDSDESHAKDLQAFAIWLWFTRYSISHHDL